MTCDDVRSSTIHSPYYLYYYLYSSTTAEKASDGVKFRCERDVLVEALGTAGRATASRGGALPVLAGIRTELAGDTLTLTGHDLELTIAVAIREGVKGSADGIAVLPARLVSDVVRSLAPGAVEVEVDGEQANITSGRSEFTLRVFPVDEFPRLPEAGGEGVTLDAGELAAALRQVVPAASSDDARPILTGVLLTAEQGGLRLVATDSFRLAVRDLPGQSVLAEGQSVLVPSRALNDLTKVLGGVGELTVRLGERDAGFEAGDVRLTTMLIEGDFPNYRGLIPSSHANRLTVSREGLLEGLRRVKLLAREATPVRLAMSSEGLDLVAVTQDVGQAHESLDAKYEGTELTVAFNPEYLLQGVEVLQGDEVLIETVDSLKPALVRSPEHGEFLYLLMPVRVS
ncbi:MAG TPA: DNA polymerase III subunit beta [Acidimicrobiales bacterium]|nr:DNA polymerase III subunit beta [Acidimicrobiales bacterium]